MRTSVTRGVIVVIGCLYEENSLYGWVCGVTLIVKIFFREGGDTLSRVSCLEFEVSGGVIKGGRC